MEETARTGGELAGIRKSDGCGKGCPRGVGEGIGNPLIAVVDVVFNDYEAAAGFQVANELAQNRFFVVVEV